MRVTVQEPRVIRYPAPTDPVPLEDFVSIRRIRDGRPGNEGHWGVEVTGALYMGYRWEKIPFPPYYGSVIDDPDAIAAMGRTGPVWVPPLGPEIDGLIFIAKMHILHRRGKLGWQPWDVTHSCGHTVTYNTHLDNIQIHCAADADASAARPCDKCRR